MTVRLITLQPDEWEKYREIRIAALTQAPTAFGTSVKKIKSFPPKEWQDRLKKAAEEKDMWIYFAQIGDEIIGMTGARRDSGEASHHVAMIFSVFVKESFRGKGYAKKLLTSILDKLANQPDIIKAKLHVVSTQKEAISLYKRCGFKLVGTLKKEFNRAGTLHDEYIMEKFLH